MVVPVTKPPPQLAGSVDAGHGRALVVVEVEPTPPVGGNVVWEWHARDHLIQDFDPAQDNYGVVGDHPELVDPNGWIEGDKNQINAFWNHMNSINYNAEFDQIMLSVRGSSDRWIRATTCSSTCSPASATSMSTSTPC